MKFFTNFLIALTTMAMLIACESKINDEGDSTSKVEQADSTTSGTSRIPENGSMEGDTINLHGKFVLFYGPASTVDTVSAEISAFQTTTSEILDSLKNVPGIYAGYTSVNNIRVFDLSSGKPMIIMRNTFKEPTGLIISDGMQSPVIKKGIVSGDEYRELISKYFVRPS